MWGKHVRANSQVGKSQCCDLSATVTQGCLCISSTVSLQANNVLAMVIYKLWMAMCHFFRCAYPHIGAYMQEYFFVGAFSRTRMAIPSTNSQACPFLCGDIWLNERRIYSGSHRIIKVASKYLEKISIFDMRHVL